ncbi:MAG: gliding motility-associated C-terminal domain-containing protein [Flavobacteriales bacterium]|nr:gliding motility-associated C-terminal domain-containing protein [Flavobacteriales bacterium]
MPSDFFKLFRHIAAFMLVLCSGLSMAQDSCDVSLELLISPGYVLCGNNNTVDIMANSTNSGNNPSYVWYVNGAYASNGTTFSSNSIQDGDTVMAVVISSTNCQPAATDTGYAVFSVSNVMAEATPDSATCNTADGSVTVHDVTGGAPPFTYILNSGTVQEDSVFTDLEAGIYTIEVIDDNGCSWKAAVTVPIKGSIQQVNIGTTNTTCGLNDGTIFITNIQGSTGPFHMALSNGDSVDVTSLPYTFDNLPSAVYSLSIYDSDLCKFEVYYLYVGIDNPITNVPVEVTPHTCVAYGQLVIDLNNVSGGVAPYQISMNGGNSFTSQFYYPDLKLGTYPIMVRDVNGCMYQTSAEVPFECEFPETLLYPFNAFTPNDDGVNDLWTIAGIEVFKSHKVVVYNRWGQLVFESEEYSNEDGWDGKFHGSPLPEATYFYVLDVTGWDEKEIKKSGIVTIVR